MEKKRKNWALWCTPVIPPIADEGYSMFMDWRNYIIKMPIVSKQSINLRDPY
jgi:hypothetical protein